MNTDDVVLALEDDRVDALSLQHAFRDAGIANPLLIFATAKEGLAHLQQAGVLPSLILLDLNLPGMAGMEFLRTVKNDTRLRRIPVVVLTSSNEERDRHQTFDLSAAGYIVKPLKYTAFVEMIEAVMSYWHMNQSPD